MKLFNNNPEVPRPLALTSAYSWRLLVISAAIALLSYIVVYLRVVTLPVILAIFAATLLAPMVSSLRKRGWNSALATTTVLLGSLVIIGGVFAATGPVVANEVSTIRSETSFGTDQLVTLSEKTPFPITREQVDNSVDSSVQWVKDNSQTLTAGAFSGAVLIGEIITGLILMITLLFYYLKDGRQIWGWIVNLFPKRQRKHIDAMGHDAWGTLGAYLRGVSIIAAIDAVLIGITLVILGVPLALPLALLTFIGGFLPLIGAITAGFIAVLVALLTQGPIIALIVLAAIIIIQQVEGNVFYPFIVGRSVELHGVAILIAIGIGAVVGGVVGAFMAVPVAAVAYGQYLYLSNRKSEATADSE